MAITKSCKEALWLKGLSRELSEQLHISTLFYDSQSAIFLTKVHMFHERMKHTNARYHFVCEINARGDIFVSEVRTQDNLADMSSKNGRTHFLSQNYSFCFFMNMRDKWLGVGNLLFSIQ